MPVWGFSLLLWPSPLRHRHFEELRFSLHHTQKQIIVQTAKRYLSIWEQQKKKERKRETQPAQHKFAQWQLTVHIQVVCLIFQTSSLDNPKAFMSCMVSGLCLLSSSVCNFSECWQVVFSSVCGVKKHPHRQQRNVSPFCNSIHFSLKAVPPTTGSFRPRVKACLFTSHLCSIQWFTVCSLFIFSHTLTHHWTYWAHCAGSLSWCSYSWWS